MKTSFFKILSDERYDGSHYMLEVDFFQIKSKPVFTPSVCWLPADPCRFGPGLHSLLKYVFPVGESLLSKL